MTGREDFEPVRVRNDKKPQISGSDLRKRKEINSREDTAGNPVEKGEKTCPQVDVWPVAPRGGLIAGLAGTPALRAGAPRAALRGGHLARPMAGRPKGQRAGQPGAGSKTG